MNKGSRPGLVPPQKWALFHPTSIEFLYNRSWGVPHLQQGSLDSQDLHGISTGQDLQRVGCFADCLDVLVDFIPHLTVNSVSAPVSRSAVKRQI